MTTQQLYEADLDDFTMRTPGYGAWLKVED